MNNEDLTSIGQDAWIEICETARGELAKYVPKISKMKPYEIKIFIDALNQAMWANEQALSFDKRMSHIIDRLPYDDGD